jgi:murein DD-endopeptidase MepM/ murein hydrolase activator NlpD
MNSIVRSAAVVMLLALISITLAYGKSFRHHRVRFGETLWQISRRYNVPPEKIMRANHITARNYLVVGQMLLIPEPSERKLIYPLPRRVQVTSPFGLRIHPITGRRELHKGVDLAAKMRTPVRAAAAGLVRFAGRMRGYGLVVMIEHGDGLSTLYAHLSAISVMAGRRVKAGEGIGYTGNSGLSTGPHLHFEVRVKDEPVDPEKFIEF